jgi:hypothetical protein
MQQLNLFLQKDLARNWTAFVNFELVNSYSSFRQWGAFNLEEAWTRFRFSKEFNLKLGLQIPIFNNLNEIKNRTPLLPYIVRPLVYETSFNEFIALEEYLPARSYVQSYGFFALGESKLDYAIYLGNSPNINNNRERDQTGIDTTSAVLVGGRLGFRTGELKAGVSATADKINFDLGPPENRELVASVFNAVPADFEDVSRRRFGSDLSFRIWNFSFEGEYISVIYDDDISDFSVDKKFYYGTLGFHITEKLFLYGSYWFVEEDFLKVDFISQNDIRIISTVFQVKVPNFGVAYHFTDRLTFKAHIARANIESPTDREFDDEVLEYLSGAVSVFF